MPGNPVVHEMLASLFCSKLTTGGHFHELGEVVDHHQYAGIPGFGLANLLMVDLHYLNERSAYYVLERELLSSNGSLGILACSANFDPFFHSIVHSSPDESLSNT